MIAKIIAELEWQRSIMSGTLDDVMHFMRGFRSACKALGYELPVNHWKRDYRYQGWYKQPWWQFPKKTHLQAMQELEYSHIQMMNEIFDIEIDAWKRIAEEIE